MSWPFSQHRRQLILGALVVTPVFLASTVSIAKTYKDNIVVSELSTIVQSVMSDVKLTTSHIKVESRVTPKKENIDTLLVQPPHEGAAPFINVLDNEGAIFLPLNDLNNLFNLKLKTRRRDPASGHEAQQITDIAQNQKEQTYELNFKKQIIKIDDTLYKITKDNLRIFQGQIYINSANFTEWFGIRLEIDTLKSTIHFVSNNPLTTSDEERENERKWYSLMSSGNILDNNFLPTEDSYLNNGFDDWFNDIAPYQLDKRTIRRPSITNQFLIDHKNYSALAWADRDSWIDNPLRYKSNITPSASPPPKASERLRIEPSVPTVPDSINEPIPYFNPLDNDVLKGNDNSKEDQASLITSSMPEPKISTSNTPPTQEDNKLSQTRSGVSEYTNAVPNNTVSLTAVRNKRTLGAVDAYVDRQNIYLRLKNVIGLLDLTYTRDSPNDKATITLKNGSALILDFKTREYIDGNKHYSFYAYDIYKYGDDIYANTDLLTRLIPSVGFVVDLEAQQVDLSDIGTGLFGSWSNAKIEDQSTIAPAPQAAPYEPVIVDDGTNRPAFPEQIPNANQETGDVLHLSDHEYKSLTQKQEGNSNETLENSSSPQEDIGNENGETGELLILQPRIKNAPPRNEFIEALEEDGRIYLPLNDLIQLFEFPIKIDDGNNRATGFFIKPENSFDLDILKRTIVVGEKSWTITRQNVRRHQGGIYISCESFSEWFGIKIDISRSNATIHFITDQLLPQEEKELRQKRWDQLIKQTENSDKNFALLQNPYQLIGDPVLDVSIGTMYNHAPSSAATTTTKTSPITGDYNIQGSEEIGYLTSQFYAEGASETGAVNLLRIKAGRTDNDANLLGPLRATAFSFGDVTAPTLNLVTSNSLGRGFSVTNRDINASENFDFHNFSGDSTPGYEVELYRNDELVAFQNVDSSGRYNFLNIPVLYGKNIFRVVIYGEQGEREERVETIDAASTLLKAGQMSYTVGVEQRGETLLPLNKENVSSLNLPSGTEAVSNIRYGITRDWTVGAALAETKVIDGNHEYASASVNGEMCHILTETNLVQDITNGGWAGSVSALTGFNGINLSGRYRKFHDFLSEAVNSTNLPLTSDQSLNVNTHVSLPVLGSFSTGLSYLRESFSDTTLVPRYTYGFQTSKSMLGVSFTNSINYVLDELKVFQDSFGIQTRIFNVDLRALGLMDIKPNQKLQDANFAGDYKLTDRLSAQTQFDKNLITNETTYGQNFNYDFDQFRLSFTSQKTNGGGYSAGLNLIFSLNHDPLSDSWHSQPQAMSDGGAVAGHVYIDENKNKQYDNGEPLVKDVVIKLDGAPIKSNSDEYFVAPVPPYLPNRFVLDPNTITDPLLTPAIKGYRILTRPGDTVVANFPLVRTTIIDGTVTLFDEKGNKRELSDIVVELEDSTGKAIRRVISEVDGYFSFDKVESGNYFLSIPDEALASYHAILDQKVPINIEEINEFKTGNEISLHLKTEVDDFTIIQSILKRETSPSLETPVSKDDTTPAFSLPLKQNLYTPIPPKN